MIWRLLGEVDIGCHLTVGGAVVASSWIHDYIQDDHLQGSVSAITRLGKAMVFLRHSIDLSMGSSHLSEPHGGK